jgi:hypothetical protein
MGRSPFIETCERKKRYASRGEAQRAVRLMQKWSKGHCETLHVYLCEHCRGFHAGRDLDRRR